jgi:predicted DCC family thiol-disulfide oxidoreductase YuxK
MLERFARDDLFRIDARTLGLFRVALGLTLVVDLARRAAVLPELYSNLGVLPNHAHLFIHRGGAPIFSIFHALSTPTEVAVGFALTLVCFALFTLGLSTRVMHAASLFCFASLAGRNALLSSPGDALVAGLLAFTLFLPLGSRFSLDAFTRSMREEREKGPDDLNGRVTLDVELAGRARSPGWSPTSLAAVGALGFVCLAHLASGLSKTEPEWADGSALHYFLLVDGGVSSLGVRLRQVPGVTRALGLFVRWAELAIPALVVLGLAPHELARRALRGAAVALALAHALVYALFFDLGVLAGALASGALLFVPRAQWDDLAARPSPRRFVTGIYDEDCGICFWLARALARADFRRHVVFQGNGSLEALAVRDPSTLAIVTRDLPAQITPELVTETVVVVDHQGEVHVRSRAIATALGAMPLGRPLELLMKLPLVSPLLDRLYDVIAARRLEISVALGLGACGLVRPSASARAAEPPPPPPSTRLRRGAQALVREALALVLALTVLAAARASTPALARLPGPRLAALVPHLGWLRLSPRFTELSLVPRETGRLVIDAGTPDAPLDLVTRRPPALGAALGAPSALGPLWARYAAGVRAHEPYQRELRDYLARGGRGAKPGESIASFDVLWVSTALPPPTEPAVCLGLTRAPSCAPLEARVERVITRGKGGPSRALWREP